MGLSHIFLLVTKFGEAKNQIIRFPILGHPILVGSEED
jgi:hypothetical protein